MKHAHSQVHLYFSTRIDMWNKDKARSHVQDIFFILFDAPEMSKQLRNYLELRQLMIRIK